MKIVKAVEDYKCRMLNRTNDKLLKGKHYVGENQKDFETGQDEEVFLLYYEAKKVCTVYAFFYCGKIQDMKSDSSDVMFIDPKGLWMRPIIFKTILKHTEFDVAYMAYI